MRLLAIVGAAAVLATVVAAVALLAGDGSGDVVARAEPESPPHVRRSAQCGEGDFSLEFDSSGGALVRQRGEVLARASVDFAKIDCDAAVAFRDLSAAQSPYHGELEGPSTESGTITCRTDAQLELSVHPVLYREAPSGSVILVADRRTKRMLASATFARDPFDGRIWPRAFWDAAVCSVGR